MKTVYKVVRVRSNGTLKSAVVEARGWIIRYRVGQTVRRCMAFGSLRAAINFASKMKQETRIYKAACRSARPIRSVTYWDWAPALVAFEKSDGYKDGWDAHAAPHGTLYCHGLKLVERVK